MSLYVCAIDIHHVRSMLTCVFAVCVCVVIRLSLVYKASAQSLCAVSGLPTFSANTADAPSSWWRKKARYQNECTRRTSCCCCVLCVSVHMLSPSRSDMFCRVKTSTHLRAFDSVKGANMSELPFDNNHME